SGLGEGQRARPAPNSPSSRSHFVVVRLCKSMSSPACRALRSSYSHKWPSPWIGLAYCSAGLHPQGRPQQREDGMSQEILCNVEDSIATITLNRPERMNALTHELEAELHRIFDRADADRAVRVIILTGAGRAFCAGYDQSTTDKSGARHS